MNYKGLEDTNKWFDIAAPDPTTEMACVQIGCHMEEFAEMLEALGLEISSDYIHGIAKRFKQKDIRALNIIKDANLLALADSMGDQQITSTGVMKMFKMDPIGILNEINRSNFSKFEDGKPVFDENGKIGKGKYYIKPNLKPYI